MPTDTEIRTILKNAELSAKILSFVLNGSSLKDAFKHVLGEGYYDCLVEELYSELRAKKQNA